MFDAGEGLWALKLIQVGGFGGRDSPSLEIITVPQMLLLVLEGNLLLHSRADEAKTGCSSRGIA